MATANASNPKAATVIDVDFEESGNGGPQIKTDVHEFELTTELSCAAVRRL